MPSLCFVAGDPSGDQQAARLISALKSRPGPWTVTGLGGPAMQASGATLLDDLTKAAAIGPFDAAKFIGRFARARRLLDAHLAARRPDLVILVDFGDFNLPIIAPLVKRHRLPLLYYISPQVWAWGAIRMRLIRRYVDRMVVFFPFEETLYQQAGVPVTWVGHPLADLARPTVSRDAALQQYGLNPWRRTVGLLPGSREHEIRRHLPLFLSAAQRIAWHMPGVQFLLPKAPGISQTILQAEIARAKLDVHIADGPVHDALQVMEAAVVASGTATLDAALSEVPMAVVYRSSWPTYLVARSVVRLSHIALVNVVAGRQVVPEFIQHRAAPARIADAVIDLLRDDEQCEKMKAGLREVKTKLGPPGAVARAADAVLDALARASV